MSNKRKVPQEVKKSFLFWLVAIAAGVFEMIIAVSEILSKDSGPGNSIFIAVGIRTIIFTVLVYIIMKMYRGRNWARIALAILLGGIGTLSLIIDPVKWILEGNSLDKALAGMTFYSILFGLSRIVHLASVIVAFILMFRPAANHYFRAVA
ncbi:hypothetical protein AN963_24920 [Brevibacillus choshinensis]|uniref:Uncharacterized protein n=2 Tax=Brevibacillus choshinensis TaxID=54911 RepID=A0ABR5N289_BRECH|nr:hypothetical protein AN963_24920 [Brevibacillus choshinensis]